MKPFSNFNQVEELLDTSLEKIKSLMEANTIIGDPVTTITGTIIIPVSKVSVGFIVGSGEYSDQSNRRVANHYPLAGGSGGGMSVSPVGFLVESNGDIKFVDIEDKSAYQTILNLVNTIINKIGGENAGSSKNESDN